VDRESATSAGTEIGEYLLPLIHARREKPAGDIISLLTRSEIDGEKLDDEDILGFCRNLFPAAIDTSTNSLGSLLSHVLPDREIWGRVAHDHDLREAVIQELLRFEPRLVMIPRRAAQDVELGGHKIRRGDDIRICLVGSHDDPTVYENPRSFRTDRKQNNFAFGHGEHFCLGTQMARRVIEKGLEVLAITPFSFSLFRFLNAMAAVHKPLRGNRGLALRTDRSVELACAKSHRVHGAT
jgi:cytochrome P450